jgi:hypothetical protein
MQVARHWRLKAQRYRLEGAVCPRCGHPTFPPRPVCPQCAASAPIERASTVTPALFLAVPQILPANMKNLQPVS